MFLWMSVKESVVERVFVFIHVTSCSHRCGLPTDYIDTIFLQDCLPSDIFYEYPF